MTTNLINRPLTVGSHQDPKEGACVIEWLRLHENLEFSDARLPCQSRVIHRFLIGLNDRIKDDDLRQQLKPIALASLGTADDGRDKWRAFRLADVACREWAPAALEARGRREDADKLRNLKPVTDRATARSARDLARAYAAAAAAYVDVDADAAAAYAYAAAADADAAAAYVDAYAAADAAAYVDAYAAADAAADAAYAAAAYAADAAYAAAAYAAAAADAAADAAYAAAAAAAAAPIWIRAVALAGELVAAVEAPR